jgi:predicted small lipoprotein YifL
MRICLLLAILSLAACGQAGDLYLPDKKPEAVATPAPVSAPAPAPAAPADPEKKDEQTQENQSPATPPAQP